MSTQKKPAPAPAPAAAPAPAPAPAGGGQTTQSPVPAPAVSESDKQDAAQQSTPPPEVTGVPAQTSPAGVVLNPHVPAPIPPREPNPALPKEAQPAAQGSLTPAQTEDKKKRNPAIKEAPSPIPAPQTTQAVDDGPKNEDGFTPGEEVSGDRVIAIERERMRKEREERAKKRAAQQGK